MADNSNPSTESNLTGMIEETSSHVLGQYQFTVNAGNRVVGDKIPKNVNFTYSEQLNTLFVKRREKCPFEIASSVHPPPGSEIMINIYTHTPERVPVMLCSSHAQDEFDADVVSPFHFARCENKDAIYACCDKTGELTIRLPFKGNGEMDIENLVFFCYSSCIKVKNIFLKFSLINREEVLGHHIFSLHVCSTPGRDRENHEKTRSGKVRSKKNNIPSRIRSRASAPGSEMFTMRIKKRETYNMLKMVNHLLELKEAIPQHIQDKYLKRYQAQNDIHTGTTSSCTSSSTCTTSSDVRFTYRRIIKASNRPRIYARYVKEVI